MEKTPSVAIMIRRAPAARASLRRERRSATSPLRYRYRAALHRRTPSMMEAWLSSSETIASSAPSSSSKIAPFASKQEEKRIASSVPSQSASSRSSSRCGVWVPQMKRTEDSPKPHWPSASWAASRTRESSASPR